MHVERFPALASLHTFGLAARARFLCRFDDATSLMTWLKNNRNVPRLVLGGGSNLLFIDDYDGVIIKPENRGIDVSVNTQHVELTVAAGENWHQLVSQTTANGWGGLENLALIPGLAGAAPVQNIGAYGTEFANVCTSVDALNTQTGVIQRFTVDDCAFGYRDSFFKHQPAGLWVVNRISLMLPSHWQPTLRYQGLRERLGKQPTPQEVMQAVVEIRKQKLPDPEVMGNAGSFFKNPVVSAAQAEQLLQQYPDLVHYQQMDGGVKLAAGWLIDRLGLKGFAVGGAAVHTQQALVLVNKGHAKARDLVTLAWEVKTRVSDAFGVILEPEVRLIGNSCELTLDEAYGVYH